MSAPFAPTRHARRHSPLAASTELWRCAALLCLPAAPLLAQAQAPTTEATLARNLAATCANCHGTNGNAQGEMKALAGRPAEAIVAMMAAYKNGSLSGTIMHQIAKGYTDEQIRLVAGYLAAQKPAAK